jgi:uncharacterized damage-inducible protein DinB
MSSDLRYPVGHFERQHSSNPTSRAAAIDEIAALPGRLTAAIEGLSDAQLDTPYRDEGWTVRQVVHHLPDSHVNAYIRMKLAATENRPPAKTYDEAAWAELPEAKSAPVDLSLPLLAALHARWTTWLRTLDDVTAARSVLHPEWGDVSIDELIQLYAWHCRHHVAHITALRARMGW